MEVMTLNTLVSIHIDYIIDQLEKNGFVEAGHNGPYLDPEKATRNTAHALYTLASFYKIDPRDDIKNAAEIAIDYLCSSNIRPGNATFYCRDKTGKDHCNGLVGQAWVIEAFVKASLEFDRPDCYLIAEEVFLMHHFNEDIGIWHRVEIDGSVLSFDETFNHQLWFAAAACLLYKTPEAQKQSLTFLQKVAGNPTLYSNGVIFHSSPMGSIFGYLTCGIRVFASQLKKRLLVRSSFDGLYSKSVGYHGFNLYAYSILKEAFPEEPIWSSILIDKIINVVDTIDFRDELKKSKFGYFYNVSGIEFAYAFEVLCQDYERAHIWLLRQFEFSFKDKQHPLIKGSLDPNTSMVRLYQATRLRNDYELKDEI